VSPRVDVRGALGLLAEIGPGLAGAERALHAAEPDLPTTDVLDRALRQALDRLAVEVSPQTFVYLRWRVEHARAASGEARGPLASDARPPIATSSA
jgi:hypothetical protein